MKNKKKKIKKWSEVALETVGFGPGESGNMEKVLVYYNENENVSYSQNEFV